MISLYLSDHKPLEAIFRSLLKITNLNKSAFNSIDFTPIIDIMGAFTNINIYQN